MTEFAPGAGEGQGGQESGGETQDFFKRFQAEIHDVRHRSESSERRAAAAERRLQEVGRMLSGEEPATKDQMAWFDNILNVAFEAEKNGQPIPVTVEIATQLAQTQKQLAEAMQLVEALKKGQRELADPVTTQENQTYQNIDDLISSRVEEFYGEENPHISAAIANAVVEEIKDMRENDPDLWKKVMKNRAYQQKLVDHFASQVVPKGAKRLISEVQEVTTPVTMSDLQQAMAEAKQVQDPALRSEIMTALRQQYWEIKNSKQR